ncbi:MAG: hypothetical protein AAGF11_21030 [Myxococcota bacterium]
MTSGSQTLPPSAVADLGTDRVHTLVVPGVRFVNLRLYDFTEQELPDLGCELRVASRELLGRTDPEAKVSLKISAGLANAEAILVVDSTAFGYGHPLPVQLGELPPIEDPRGQRVRLDNLGYVAVDVPKDEPAPWSIEEFQCEHGLTVDGDCGPLTQAKLVEVHGH